jgi:GTP-binding protein
MFTMYPQAELTGHPSFLATEHHLLSKILSREVELPGIKKPRRRHHHSRRRRKDSKEEEEEPLMYFDLTKPTPLDSPILLVSGGQPGLGNPSFLTHEDRSPKYATKGGAGETMRLTLEVKSNGEVGLVGFPNAGKSTLLRSLTGSTPRVANYAFTTLNPHLGTCVVYDDGTFSGPRFDPSSSTSTLSDTPSSPTHFSGTTFSSSSSSDEGLEAKSDKREEKLRFTITDNPGLLPNSHLNHGLGHEFLRHIERCTSLVYVIDLSNESSSGGGGGIKMDPVESLKVLENSLIEYEKVRGLKPRELVNRVKGVVGNKADLFGSNPRHDEEEGAVSSVEEGKQRLQLLQDYVSRREREVDEGGEKKMWVIPVSAKHRQNVSTLVHQLAKDVEDEREKQRLRIEREESGEFDADDEVGPDEDYDRWVR